MTKVSGSIISKIKYITRQNLSYRDFRRRLFENEAWVWRNFPYTFWIIKLRFFSSENVNNGASFIRKIRSFVEQILNFSYLSFINNEVVQRRMRKEYYKVAIGILILDKAAPVVNQSLTVKVQSYFFLVHPQ